MHKLLPGAEGLASTHQILPTTAEMTADPKQIGAVVLGEVQTPDLEIDLRQWYVERFMESPEAMFGGEMNVLLDHCYGDRVVPVGGEVLEDGSRRFDFGTRYTEDDGPPNERHPIVGHYTITRHNGGGTTYEYTTRIAGEYYEPLVTIRRKPDGALEVLGVRNNKGVEETFVLDDSDPMRYAALKNFIDESLDAAQKVAARSDVERVATDNDAQDKLQFMKSLPKGAYWNLRHLVVHALDENGLEDMHVSDGYGFLSHNIDAREVY